MANIQAAEHELFAPLLNGLLTIDGVTVWGVHGFEGRTPTAAFTVAGHTPAEVTRALAAAKVAVWDGHNYAVEVVGQLGLADCGGVVRAGISRYIEPEDVTRLLSVVQELAR